MATPFVLGRVAYLSVAERAKHARWVCGTLIDEFLDNSQGLRNQQRQQQLLFTSRKVFQSGVGLSEQLGSGKIDPLWLNEMTGKLIDPKTELPQLKNQLKIFIDSPPISVSP